MVDTTRGDARTRVLFIAEAVTLAHVARLVTLANALPADRYAVTLATDPRYDHLLGKLPYPVERIHTIPGERFFKALQNGTPIYDTATLERYVEEDRRLLAEYKPDVVVGDFRLSLDVSARLARVPYATVTNAYWSPYARIDYPVPELPIAKILGVGLAQRLFDLFRPLVSRLHARPINQLRQRHGLQPLQPDTRVVYTHADYTLYADLPSLVAMERTPPNHAFIGPLLWSPRVMLPAWWHELPRNGALAYVTLGSSGQSEVLPAVLDALAALRISAVVATADRTKATTIRPGVWEAGFLPGDVAAARASVVVCNGGSPSCYQALAAGVPVIGIPSNLDQFLNMSLVAKAGAGILVRPEAPNRLRLRRAILHTMQSADLRIAAHRLRTEIIDHPAPRLFEMLLSKVLGSHP